MTAQDEALDFATTDIQPGQRFRLVTGLNKSGKPAWRSAMIIP